MCPCVTIASSNIHMYYLSIHQLFAGGAAVIVVDIIWGTLTNVSFWYFGDEWFNLLIIFFRIFSVLKNVFLPQLLFICQKFEIKFRSWLFQNWMKKKLHICLNSKLSSWFIYECREVKQFVTQKKPISVNYNWNQVFDDLILHRHIYTVQSYRFYLKENSEFKQVIYLRYINWKRNRKKRKFYFLANAHENFIDCINCTCLRHSIIGSFVMSVPYWNIANFERNLNRNYQISLHCL